MTTSSVLNGPLVLRHELGHSILDVGEEYDGGELYTGSNSAHDILSIPWTHWFSDPNRVDESGNPRVERSVMSMQAYPWTLLNTTSPWSVEFKSSGTYSRYMLTFSLSGIPHARNLRISLDGSYLEWAARGDVGDDRWFYNFLFDESLKPGTHILAFELLNSEIQGTAQLCSVEILEYGDENECVLQNFFFSGHKLYLKVYFETGIPRRIFNVRSAFACLLVSLLTNTSFSSSYDNQTSYRPTNEECLMRAVAYPNFCKVCLETLWLKLLQRISLIDNLTERCERRPGVETFLKIFDLDLLPLADLRQEPIAMKESYTIIWKKNGGIMEEFTNRTRVELGDDGAIGNYSVHIKFETEEVRKASQYLEAERRYEVEMPCSSVSRGNR